MCHVHVHSCRIFHIPLQSGSDDVLKLMRRRYDTALFASKIRKIKEIMPDAFYWRGCNCGNTW